MKNLFVLIFIMPVFVYTSEIPRKRVHDPYGVVVFDKQHVQPDVQELTTATFSTKEQNSQKVYQVGQSVVSGCASSRRMQPVVSVVTSFVAGNTSNPIKSAGFVEKRIFDEVSAFNNLYGWLNKADYEKNDETVINYLRKNCEHCLNGINVDTGQGLVHALIPVISRHKELMKKLQAIGMDLTLQTQIPDSFPGSTLLHCIAGSIARIRLLSNARICLLSNAVAVKKRFNDYVEKTETTIQHRIECLAWLCEEYPQALMVESFGKKRGITPLKILSLEDKLLIEKVQSQSRETGAR